jgi:hypothetical protein
MIDIVLNFDIYTIIHLPNICTHKTPFSNEAKTHIIEQQKMYNCDNKKKWKAC